MLRYLFKVATTTARNRRQERDLDTLLSQIERDGVGADREATLAKLNALLNPKNPLLTVDTLRRISHALGPEAYIAFGDPISPLPLSGSSPTASKSHHRDSRIEAAPAAQTRMPPPPDQTALKAHWPWYTSQSSTYRPNAHGSNGAVDRILMAAAQP